MAPERLSRRVSAITESATLAVDARAKALKAAGEPVIGFGAGEPDFPTPAHVVEAAVEAARDVKNHRYTPAAGLPELKEAIVAKTLRDSKVEVSASQVLVTNGGKHAVYNTFEALLNPGDGWCRGSRDRPRPGRQRPRGGPSRGHNQSGRRREGGCWG